MDDSMDETIASNDYDSMDDSIHDDVFIAHMSLIVTKSMSI